VEEAGLRIGTQRIVRNLGGGIFSGGSG